MDASPDLFNVEPFSRPTRRRSAPRRSRPPLPPAVQSALDDLRRTLEAMPGDEMERRRVRWEDTIAQSRRS